jgi:hypothetical protein
MKNLLIIYRSKETIKAWKEATQKREVQVGIFRVVG